MNLFQVISKHTEANKEKARIIRKALKEMESHDLVKIKVAKKLLKKYGIFL